MKKGSIILLVIMSFIGIAVIGLLASILLFGFNKKENKSISSKEELTELSEEEKKLYEVFKFDTDNNTMTTSVLKGDRNLSNFYLGQKALYVGRYVKDDFVNLYVEGKKYNLGELKGFYEESTIKDAFETLFGVETYNQIEFINVIGSCNNAFYNKNTKRYEQVEINNDGCSTIKSNDEYTAKALGSKIEDNYLIIREEVLMKNDVERKKTTYLLDYYFDKDTKIFLKTTSKIKKLKKLKKIKKYVDFYQLIM